MPRRQGTAQQSAPAVPTLPPRTSTVSLKPTQAVPAVGVVITAIAVTLWGRPLLTVAPRRQKTALVLTRDSVPSAQKRPVLTCSGPEPPLITKPTAQPAPGRSHTNVTKVQTPPPKARQLRTPQRGVRVSAGVKRHNGHNVKLAVQTAPILVQGGPQRVRVRPFSTMRPKPALTVSLG